MCTLSTSNIELIIIIFSPLEIPTPPLNAPNNIIKLIIKTYVHDMLEAGANGGAGTTGGGAVAVSGPEMKDKLVSLSDYIATHPALHQRYLWVGPSPPPADYNPDIHELHYEEDGPRTTTSAGENGGNSTTTRRLLIRKRSHHTGAAPSKLMEQLPSEEICETKQKWEQINETHDLYENKVKVVQQDDMHQFVFTYRCAQNKGKWTSRDR